MPGKSNRGLIIIHTGNGKGKTTAAMGLALRGVGHGHRVLMIQFIKGSWKYGELEAIKKLTPLFEIIPMGKGFIGLGKEKGPTKEDIRAVRDAWEFFLEQKKSDKYDMIILDEINLVLSYDILDLEDVIREIGDRPEGMHLVLTGRGAPRAIIEAADLVTEMNEIKHPFNKGVKAQKGIEF